MALLKLPFVETARTRLEGFWPSARQKAVARFHFKGVSRPDFDQAALARAHRLYAGLDQLSGDQFLTLDWLSCFAKSGRQLLMQHGLRLLEDWSQQAVPLNDLPTEARQLRDLSNAAIAFASTLHDDQLKSLNRAFDIQLQRLNAIKTRHAVDHLTKAFALLSASHCLQQGQALQQDALRLLDLALPQLIASDGGPTAHRLDDYIRWVSPLLLEHDISFTPRTRHALDRARPFLSMLLTAQHSYCEASETAPVAEVLETPALRLADLSRVARLSCHKTTAIALPATLTGTTSLDVSAQGHHLARASLFLHDGQEDQSVTLLTQKTSENGEFLLQETAQSSRMVFLSPKGDDIRVEDQWSHDTVKRWMRIDLPVDAKISIARNGTLAAVALDHRHLWHLSLRGAKLLTQQDDGILIAETREARVNWALKRQARTASKPEKMTEAELPF
jgi:hypothetical protein